jgi:hypothetical protein
MTQLSLFTEPTAPPILTLLKEPKFFCDVFVHSCIDEKTKRIRISPLDNQPVDSCLYVCCSHKARNLFPAGTIFKLDLRLAHGKNGSPYLKARAGRPMGRAIEYFEHNLALQKEK